MDHVKHPIHEAHQAVVSANGGMDTTYCMYYGLMCLVNGVFDVILCVERWMRVKYPLFASHAPFMFNFASVVFLVCPAIELASAMLSYYIYVDAQEAESRVLMPHFQRQAREIAAAQAAINGAPPGERRPPDQGFMPFHGRGHRL